MARLSSVIRKVSKKNEQPKGCINAKVQTTQLGVVVLPPNQNPLCWRPLVQSGGSNRHPQNWVGAGTGGVGSSSAYQLSFQPLNYRSLSSKCRPPRNLISIKFSMQTGSFDPRNLIPLAYRCTLNPFTHLHHHFWNMYHVDCQCTICHH